MICKRCGRDRTPDQFHRNTTRARGLDTQCRDCAAERKLLRRYGIGHRDYQRMLTDQGGRCAICEHVPEPGEVLAVDHSHRDGRVRALLCRSCNVGIGQLRDDPELLLRAAAYLHSHAAA
ncbi:endonuclease VII domain-containing protein [Nocardia sp. FBN12]|uniref:endonuclease VII domain-containing protein n=1 Tax=Nocardia sp. FBN12 TaxID=3419766 RepID=UPI003D07A878